MSLMSGVGMSAVISACGRYRYNLVCAWDLTKPRLCFCMLNPSTADGYVDDATVRRCVGFARGWGYGSVEIVNLFAYRTKDPSALKAAGWPVGPENDAHIFRAAVHAMNVICAWGSNARGHARVDQVLELIRLCHAPLCLARSSVDGTPKHPLYLPADLVPALL